MMCWTDKLERKPEPLRSEEKGQGCNITRARLDEMERFCADAVRAGAKQFQVAEYLGGGIARVSRWTIAGMRKHGVYGDGRFLRVRGTSLTQLMWARMDVRGSDDCWPWLGTIKPGGYGSMTFGAKAYNAHRLVYETLIGPVPEGLVLDHRCESKACVNPRHLQPVSHTENLKLHFLRCKT